MSGQGHLEDCREKAGIIKKGRPLITAATQRQVLRLFSEVCREKASPCFRVGREFRSVGTEHGDFHYEGVNRKLWGVHVNLNGFHQIINATTALGAMEVLEDLGYPVSTDAMMEGLRSVEWPGRLEMVCFLSQGPSGWSAQSGRSSRPKGGVGESIRVPAPHSSHRDS